MEHTPGPWNIDTSLHVYGMVENEGLEFGTIEQPHVCTARNYQDASLIAAAPELLEALRESVNLVRSLELAGSFKPGAFDGGLNRWNATIAKAEGR